LTYIGRGLTPPSYREVAIPHVYREVAIPYVYSEESIPHVYEEKTVKLDLKRRDN
jgi:hypothetical protein